MKATMKSRDVARAVVLTALAVALSPLAVPVGISKVMPAQHMINVVAAVMLGPAYAVTVAAATAVIRNFLGTGTALAFPGGMIGALTAALAYRWLRRTAAAAAGELVGTGLLGALASAWLVAPLIMKKGMALAAMMLAFGLSSLVGAVLGLLVLHVLRKAGIWQP
jgi:energy-coupling factor transport system ATP-binding protein